METSRDLIFKLKTSGATNEEQWQDVHTRLEWLAEMSREEFLSGNKQAALGHMRECALLVHRLIDLQTA